MINAKSFSCHQDSGVKIANRRKKSLQLSKRKTLFAGVSGNLPAYYQRFHANDTSAYRPEMWANEAVAIMYENMIYGGIVHRDFENEV